LRDMDRFDTSDCPPSNICSVPLRSKKQISLVRDGVSGKIMTHFVGLRSRMYTLRVLDSCDGEEIAKGAKGIKKSALKSITFLDYYDCLFQNCIKEVNQNFIKSQKHEVYTVNQRKIALSPHDDKRIINYITTDTLPWGFNI